MQRNFKWLLLLVISGLLFSCQKDLQQPENKQKINLSPALQAVKIGVQERLALLSGITLGVFQDNPDLFSKYQKSIAKRGLRKGREAIYFSEILNDDQSLEHGFSREFIKEFKARFNSGNYPNNDKTEAIRIKLLKEINQNSASGSVQRNFTVDEQLLFLPFLGSNIYFPFSENFQNSTVTPFTCYDPQDENATTVVVTKTKNGITTNQTVSGADDWSETHPTIVIRLDDLVAGNQLDRYNNSSCAQSDFFKTLCPNEVLDIDSVPPPPPPNPSYCGPLQSNIAPYAYTTIDDRYLIAVSIPKVRLLGNLRFGFWSGSNRIAVYRGNARIAQPNRQVFSEAVIDTSFQVMTQDISRKNGKDKTWVDCNSPYNNNWRLEQNENYVAFTVVKSWLYFAGTDINFSAKAGVVYDTATHKFIPSFTGSADVAGKISIRRREDLEAEQNINRLSLLSNALGNNFGLQGTCTTNVDCSENKDWSIRQFSTKMQFYFRVNICY